MANRKIANKKSLTTMEYWEFLLQKEGERSWRPIKLPNMEIDAGRYRVVSHSSRLNTDVEICVTHTSTDEVPPKRRSQKRSRRTNPEGLMVVIPFTYLKPGLWELRCCGDIMSDFLGKSWQHSVQLNVLSQATAALPEGEEGSPVVEVTATEAQESVNEPLSFSSSPERVIELPSTQTEAVPLTPLAQTEAVSEAGDSQQEQEINLRAVRQVNSPEAAPFVSQDEVISESQTQEEERETVLEEGCSKPVGDKEDKGSSPSQPTTDDSTLLELEVSPIDCETEQQPECSTSPPPLYAPAPSYEIPSWEAPPLTELPNPNADEVEPLPATSADLSVPLELTASDEIQNAIAHSAPEEHTSNVSEVVTPTNPILDESLQMLEQVLQQVLDPVLQELDQPEASDSQFLLLEPERALEPEPDEQGFILTLSEESLLARRGEPFTITGQVDIVKRDRETAPDASNCVFRGSLRYVLCEPQTSQILLDVQESLAEQSLPLSFSHTLEIPGNCNTRLILAKATLYSSTEAALASQSFSVTVDLDQLLGAIIPGTELMPVAKVQVPTNYSIDSLALIELQEERPELALPTVNQASIDLVNLSPNHQPFQLQPASRQPLPPQIYQPATPSPKGSKSLQLPNLPKVQPAVTNLQFQGISDTANGVDYGAVVKLDDALEQGFPAANGVSPEIADGEPADTAELTTLQLHTHEVEEWEEATEPDGALTIDDTLLSILDAIEEFDDSMSVTGSNRSDASAFSRIQPTLAPSTEPSQLATPERSDLTTGSHLDTSEASEVETTEPTATDSLWSDSEAIAPTGQGEAIAPSASPEAIAFPTVPEAENPSLENSVTEPTANDATPLDSAFPASNIQERFWTRLNSLATDTHSTTWLWPDLSSSNDNEPEEVEDFTEEALNPDLLNEFDESIWAEESEEFGSAIAFSREQNGNGTAQEAIAQSASTEQQQPPEEVSISSDEETPEQLPIEDNTEPDWTAQEFVVEDQEFVVEEDEEQPLPAPQQPETPPPPQLFQPQPIPTVEPSRPPSYSSAPEPRILSPREFETPLPEPKLLMPASELAAGETVTIRVQLPPHPTRLYVKLWVQDRQSRSLLDGPRWLVDFIPDRSGEQEALTQLIVPFGSAEIRFEAIAVDVDTQRESRKVSVDCVVVPPDLQDFSVDEF
jgi:hypothetical protein